MSIPANTGLWPPVAVAGMVLVVRVETEVYAEGLCAPSGVVVYAEGVGPPSGVVVLWTGGVSRPNNVVVLWTGPVMWAYQPLLNA